MNKIVLLRGTAAAVIAATLAWILAIECFGKVYYVAVLLPIAVFFFLIVAWCLHLRDDGFFNAPERRRHLRSMDDNHKAAPDDGRPSADPPLSLFAPLDSIVTRSGEPEMPRRAADGGMAGPALFVAAIELAVLSAVLHLVSGIGASYFR